MEEILSSKTGQHSFWVCPEHMKFYKQSTGIGQICRTCSANWLHVPHPTAPKLPFACKQIGNTLLYVNVFFASCKSQTPKPNSPNTARKFLKQPPKSGHSYRKKWRKDLQELKLSGTCTPRSIFNNGIAVPIHSKPNQLVTREQPRGGTSSWTL